MKKSTMWKVRGATRMVGVALALLALASGTARAQAGARGGQQAVVPVYVSSSGWGSAGERSQLPQDIRIMQRIVSTALEEVEAPELPGALREGDAATGTGGAVGYSVAGARPLVFSRGGRMTHIGGRDLSGFYMQGYGYLFTVTWRVSGRYGDDAGFELRAAEITTLVDQARRAAENTTDVESRAADEASRTLQSERDKLEEQQRAWQDWSARYRSLLADQLRGIVAQYGSTLNRAQPDEKITFIADFGGGESETYTVSARRGDLTGPGREQNLPAVMLAMGVADAPEPLRTELKIMAAILDSSMDEQHAGGLSVVYSGVGWSVGRDSGYQYVPGYGVLFRRNARLNLATRVIQDVASGQRGDVVVGTLRDQIDQSTEEQREAYSDHLERLKQSSAELLGTYGPTLTEMGSDEWVGIFFDVGSAAGLLEGGMSDFLVQARIQDIRQAASQPESASWLLDKLVTNQRQD